MPERSILITGCSSGIGLCVAIGLKARGYRVLATVRRAEDVARLQHKGIESFQLDLASSRSIDRAVDAALDRTGGTLDALFNNGAYGQPGAVEDLSRAALREQFETNLFGTMELTNRVIPVMRRQGHGRIIQNSSVLGLAAFPYRGAYVATKFALEGISDTLRLELKGTGIEVILIEPGPIESRFRHNALAAFLRHIDIDRGVHRDAYRAQVSRLETEGPAAPFTLPADAVLKKVILALEASRPKPRYYVTLPTYLFGTLRRILPTRWLDRALLAGSGGGKR